MIVLHVGNDSGIYLFEVGNLEPRDPKPFKANIPITMEGAIKGRYELFLFSGGRELFHSLMPA